MFLYLVFTKVLYKTIDYVNWRSLTIVKNSTFARHPFAANQLESQEFINSKESMLQVSRLASVVTAALLLPACTMGPDYQAQPQDLPEHWVLETEQVQSPRQSGAEQWQYWWEQYNDPVLNRLVTDALAQSIELRIQYERINEARAQLGLADAERFPTIGYQAEASRERLPGTAVPIDDDLIRELIESTNNQFNVSATLNYELDLWGRVARQREGAGAALNQTAFDYESAQLTLIGDVVTTYMELRATEAQHQLALQVVQGYENALELQQARFAEGEIAELEVQQAHAELASARSELPQLKIQRSTLEGALAALLGLTPAEIFNGFEEDLHHTQMADITMPYELPRLMPAELLERRPDVKAAEQAVRAATAQVGVSEADRLPGISIQGFFGTVATDSSDLFSSESRAWGITGNLAGPLIDFGRLAAGVDTANVQLRLAQAQYEATVNGAYLEVRDALDLYQYQAQLYEAFLEQQRSVARQLEMVEDAYAEGLVSFLEVLDARRGDASARQAVAMGRGQLLSASATLFKALGGSWKIDIDEQIAAQVD